MTLEQKQAGLQLEFAGIKNPQERFSRLIARGRRQPSLDATVRRDEFLVEGCLAKLWWIPSVRDRHCFFQSDSDSAIVKGVAGLLCEFYSGCTPGEILEHCADFLAAMGITQHLTANRRNGLGRVRELIRQFAASQSQPVAGSAQP